jgi:hypothetical protein
VFKQRPLPKSKKEAKRPILVRGDRPVFGFDRDAYSKL